MSISDSLRSWIVPGLAAAAAIPSYCAITDRSVISKSHSALIAKQASTLMYLIILPIAGGPEA